MGWQYQRVTGDGRSAVAVWTLNGLDDAVWSRLMQVGFPTRVEVGGVRLIAFGSEPTEDCVLLRTSEVAAELQTHGGPAVADRVERVFQGCGGKKVAQNGFDSECWAIVGRASTRRLATWLARLADGVLRTQLTQLLELPVDVAQAELAKAIENTALLETMLAGHRVAIVGLPNAGKSSLLNRLVGYERALTDPRPGATRDLIETPTAIGGYPALFIDTAGLREAGNPIEQEGIRRAQAALKSADVRVLVVDRGTPACDATLQLVTSGQYDILVAHKADLPDQSGISWQSDAVAVSSRNGNGIDDLLTRINTLLEPKRLPEDSLILPSERCMLIAREACNAAPDSADLQAWLQKLLT